MWSADRVNQWEEDGRLSAKVPDFLVIFRNSTKQQTVPIAKVANELHLPVYQIDTFRGWQVSFQLSLQQVANVECVAASEGSRPCH